jgi:hypothetical protein
MTPNNVLVPMGALIFSGAYFCVYPSINSEKPARLSNVARPFRAH